MEIVSTMSGTVWKITVAVGDEVKKGDTVVILESMKMEIPIESAFDGQVELIAVQEGDFVQENDLVVKLS